MEAAYAVRIEGIKNIFTFQIRSKTDLVEFNIQVSGLPQETFIISFYNNQKWVESQNMGTNNVKVTFSLHHDDILKDQCLSFSVASMTTKEVKLLELRFQG